jgi:hypothetical protein
LIELAANYLTFGGIYRDVHLRMVYPCHIQQVFIHPENVLNAPQIAADVHMLNQSDTPFKGRVVATAFDDLKQAVCAIEQDFEIAGQAMSVIHLRSEILEQINLWTVDRPYLYTMCFEIFEDTRLVARDLGLTNTYWAVILPGLASTLGIFFMRQSLMSLPDELLDAARVDGASEFRIFFQVVLPMSLPSLAAIASR